MPSFKIKKLLELLALNKKINPTSIGIDINDRSIEVVELTKEEGRVKASSFGRIVLNPGIVKRGRIKDEKRLSKTLKKALERAKPHPLLAPEKSFLRKIIQKTFGPKIIFALPETQVYTHIFEVEGSPKQEKIEKLARTEARKTIPLDFEDMIYSYQLLKGSKNKILLIATSKIVLKEWQSFFQNTDIKIEYFDSEVLAISRGLFLHPKKLPTTIVDIGAASTIVSIFNKNGLFYSHTIQKAGDAITREIAKGLKIKTKPAEDAKMRNGLSDPNKKIFPAIVKALEPIVKEIKLSLDYFEKQEKRKIESIVLIGGSGKLKGLIDYLKANLEYEKIWIGDCILIKQKSPLEYTKAIGSALAGINPKYAKKDPFLYLKAQPKSKILKLQKLPASSVEKIKDTLSSKTKEAESTQAKEIEKSKFGFFKSLKKIDTLEISKTRLQKNLFYFLIIIGAISMTGAFWYRENQRNKRQEAIKTKATQLAEIQVFNVTAPIATDPREYTNDRIPGRIILNTIEIARGYSETINYSREIAQENLKEGEFLWLEPITKIDPKNIIFPLNFKWLAINEARADELLVKEIDKLNKKNAEYVVNSIKKNSIEETTNPNIFNLVGRVIISAHEKIEPQIAMPIPEPLKEKPKVEVPPQAQAPIKEEIPVEILEPEIEEAVEEDQPEIIEIIEEVIIEEKTAPQRVIIKTTETGWLNVRAGAGTDFDLVGRINPGESYPLLETAEKWYKLKIDDQTEGWIFSIYAEVLK